MKSLVLQFEYEVMCSGICHPDIAQKRKNACNYQQSITACRSGFPQQGHGYELHALLTDEGAQAPYHLGRSLNSACHKTYKGKE